MPTLARPSRRDRGQNTKHSRLKAQSEVNFVMWNVLDAVDPHGDPRSNFTVGLQQLKDTDKKVVRLVLH
jgi:hypothetical protein